MINDKITTAKSNEMPSTYRVMPGVSPARARSESVCTEVSEVFGSSMMPKRIDPVLAP